MPRLSSSSRHVGYQIQWLMPTDHSTTKLVVVVVIVVVVVVVVGMWGIKFDVTLPRPLLYDPK